MRWTTGTYTYRTPIIGEKMEKKCKQVGIIDNNGYEKANRVYRGV